jgi:hypothetical protein
MVLAIMGLVLGIIGILITIGVAILQRTPKRVTYDISANRRIIDRAAYQTSGALAVMYEKRQLKDPYLMVVRVANGGKVEIRPEDWVEPFSLQTYPEIIDSGVVGTSSKDLNVAVEELKTHQVVFSKLLLNPGEWFDIQVLVDGPGGITGVSARIAGATLEPFRRPKTRQRWIPPLRRVVRLYPLLLAVWGVGLIIGYGVLKAGRSSDRAGNIAFGLVVLCISFVLLLIRMRRR